MESKNGHNPMRWDCERQGCFNRKKRPKIELLADCLPGRISFTDVDAEVEINGNFLQLEWKSHRSIATGQRLKFLRATRTCHMTVLLVEGDAETMSVDAVALAAGGTIGEWYETDMSGLREAIQQWSQWAMANPAPDLKSHFNVATFPGK